MDISSFKPPEELIFKYADTAGTLLLLNVPESLSIGIDLMMWKVGSTFRGINLIPVGIHYLYWSSSESSEIDISRLGLFLHFDTPRQTHVLRWSNTIESFSHIPEDEYRRYCEGVDNFHFVKHLGPYPLQKHDQWIESTFSMSKETISRLQPRSTLLFSPRKPLEYDSENKVHPKDAESFNTTLLMNDLCYYDFPKKNADSNLKGRDLTTAMMDTSADLEESMKILGRHGLLGEMQASFICFLLGQSYDSFSHWINCLKIFSNAESYVYKDSPLFLDVIRAVYAHVAQLPSDLSENPLFEGNVILREILNLIEITQDTGCPKLNLRSKKLQQLVCKTFNVSHLENTWDNLGEFAPVCLLEEDLEKWVV